jgi:hypothetical protein
MGIKTAIKHLIIFFFDKQLYYKGVQEVLNPLQCEQEVKS